MNAEKTMRHRPAIKIRAPRRKLNRSRAGNAALFILLAAVGAVMALPMVYSISTALKPQDELWKFPPNFFVNNPTLSNFTELFNLMANSTVPFSRFIFNTVFISLVGTAGHVIIASMCAYGLAKFRFRGRDILFNIVVHALMFNSAVTVVPLFLIMKTLKLFNTYAAYILPAVASPLGLYLMKQFIEQMVNDNILEAAKIDGASQVATFRTIVMPMVKPGWLTLTLFSFQGLWNTGSSILIISDQYKTFSYALSQILAGGIARTGPAAAAAVLMTTVPILVFLLTQSNIVETMSASGMKD